MKRIILFLVFVFCIIAGVDAQTASDVVCREIRDIEFARVVNSKGEQEVLKLDVYMPPADVSTPRPAIMLFHGGGFKPGNDKSQGYIVALCRELASKGCICISPDYRLRSDVASNYVAVVKDVVDDGASALEWVVKHAGEYSIDLDNFYVGGGSAGGVLSLNLMVLYPELARTRILPPHSRLYELVGDKEGGGTLGCIS